MHANPVGEPLEHVRVTDVAEAAEVSVGSIYHYWDTQDDFRDEVIELLLSPEEYAAAEAVGETVEALVAAGRPFTDLVRAAAAISLSGLADTPQRMRATVGLWAQDDPAIRDRLATQFAELTDAWAGLFARYFPRYGLEPRPPFTYQTIAVTLTAMVDGLHLRLQVDPTVDPDQGAEGESDDDHWSLFAASALSFLLGATRHRDAPDDLWALSRTLIGDEQPEPPEPPS